MMPLVVAFSLAAAGEGIAMERPSTREVPEKFLAEAYRELEERNPEYFRALVEIEKERREFGALYQEAETPLEKKALTDQARAYVTLALVDRIFPAWYRTKWSFNGRTEVPNGGSIACGFFVATTLRDAGFKIDRDGFGRQPAENIIKNLADTESIKRFSETDVQDVKEHVERSGDGVYIVGLDRHVGFVVNDGGQTCFVHSTNYPPWYVVSEPIDSFNPLKRSRYRVIGKILGDNMIVSWMTGKEISLKYDYFTE